MKKETLGAGLCFIVLTTWLFYGMSQKSKTTTPSQEGATPSSQERGVQKKETSVSPILQESVSERKKENYSLSFTNENGITIWKAFTYAGPFKNGFARVETTDRKYVVINERGETVDPVDVPKGLGWDNPRQDYPPGSSRRGWFKDDGTPIKFGTVGTPESNFPSETFIVGWSSHVILSHESGSFFLGRGPTHEDFVFLSDERFQNIFVEPQKVRGEGEERIYTVIRENGEQVRLLDSEVTAFLLDQDFEPSLSANKPYFDGLANQPE